jgi:hypothetical protein
MASRKTDQYSCKDTDRQNGRCYGYFRTVHGESRGAMEHEETGVGEKGKVYNWKGW